MKHGPRITFLSSTAPRTHSPSSLVLTILSLALALCGVFALLAAGGSASAHSTTQTDRQSSPVLPSSATSSTSPDCGPDWTLSPSANANNLDNNLRGVAAISSDDVWAVGYYDNGSVSQTLIEHWNGTSWQVVFSPNMGTHDNILYSVSAFSSTDVWAVGYHNNATVERTLVEHWNGTSWSIVSSANANTSANRLFSVTAVAANDAWAVGYYGNGTIWSTLIEHWNGSVWIVVFSPNSGTNNNYLFAVDAVSSTDVWAVGNYQGANYFRTLIEHYDGTSWTVAPSANVNGAHSYLQGVSAVSTGDVWAVGHYVANGLLQTLTEHWNGTAWSVVSSPNVGQYHNDLYAVAATSSGNAWAVGYYAGQTEVEALVEHWGATWSVYSSLAGNAMYLYGVASTSINDAWAVGFQPGASGKDRTLIVRYNPCTGSETPTPTPGGPVGTPTPTSTPIHCPIQFEDVPASSTFYSYVRCLACRGIISGYSCGSPGEPCIPPGNRPYFRPNANVTRGQIAKIVALSASISNPVIGQTFEDVPPGSTFYTYTEQLYDLQVMNGYSCGSPGEPCIPPGNRPYFRPNANASRGQLAKIDSNAAGYSNPPSGQTFEDVLPGSTFYTYTQRLTGRGIMSGYPCGNPEPCVPPGNRPYFRPNANVTRGQTSKIVANTFYPNCQTPSYK